LRITRIAATAGAAALAVSLGLAGCAPAGDSGSGGDTSSIITVYGTEPQNPLIPANTNETEGGKVVDSLWAGLVYYDAEGAPANDVAESIESTDQQNYTVTIKGDRTFTDGTPVTAESFVNAWDWAAQLDNAALNSYFFEDIVGFSYDENSSLIDAGGLVVVDDTTFEIHLSSVLSDYPLRLGYSAFYPMPQAFFDDPEAFGQSPIGNGPYMLASPDAWEHNVQIETVVNPDYDGPRAPVNGGITFKSYETLDAAYADLLAGNLDVLDQVPTSAMQTFEDELGDRAIDQEAAIFQSFTIPERLAHFSGEEGALRRAALSRAINRQEITDAPAIFNGTRTPAHDFTSPVIDGYSEDIPGSEVLEYDPELAVDLWAQADAISPWEGQFKIAYNADSDHQAWVDATANSIKNTLGIDAVGEPYPTFAEFRTAITDRTIDSAFRTGWQADYPGLFNFLGPLYATGAGSNDGDYSSEQFDTLLSEGAAESDLAAANAKFQEAQQVLFTDLPAIPLWYSTVQAGFSENVENVAIDWHSVPLYYEITKG
jgi:oligopeptide transport system substrate-binding protein